MPQSDIYNLNNQQNSGPTFTFNTDPTECSQECQDTYRAVFADIHAFAQNRFGVSANTRGLNIIVVSEILGACGFYRPKPHEIQISQKCADASGVARDTFAHEYFHALHVPHRSGLERGAPLWFIEGSAEYFKAIWLTQTGIVNYTYSDHRNRTIGRISDGTPPLRSDHLDVHYKLGFLAIDYLIAHTSESEVVSSFTAANWLERSVWWWGFGRRFQSVFGISLDSFYDDFAAYRRAGFPYPGAPFAPTFTFNTSLTECSQECQDAYRAAFADIHAFSQDQFGASVDASDLRITIVPELSPADVCGEFQPWSGIKLSHSQFCIEEYPHYGAFAHEYFHELHTPYILDRIGLALGAPQWFKEGSAEYFRYRWLAQLDVAQSTYGDYRSTAAERVKHRLSPTTLLSSDQEVDALRYILGFLAIDYLLAQTSDGENKVATFFTVTRPPVIGPWEQYKILFHQVFEISLDDFYACFAAHRAAGFPQPGAPCGTSAPAPAPAPAANGRIVFSSNRDGNSEIYAMNADGSNQTRLTNHSGYDGDPVWSPDGQRIAFTSGRGGNYEIYVMNADGTGVSRLTDATDGWNEPQASALPVSVSPAWSPDGQRIAFSSNRESVLGSEVYVMNADGTNVARLAPDYVSHWDSSPTWSPDGQRIAFSSHSDDGGQDIYVVNSDGSNLTRLTHSPDGSSRVMGLQFNSAPAWSPDGSRIAFVSARDDPNYAVYVMNADGSQQTSLAEQSDQRFYPPAWSPNSQRIAFSSDRDGNWDIYVMNADGSSQTKLTNHQANDLHPDWTSSGGSVTPPPGGNQLDARVAQLERQVSALQDEASVQQTRIDALKRFLAALQSLVDRLAARVAALESAAPQPQAP